jgi:hypothetical protein
VDGELQRIREAAMAHGLNLPPTLPDVQFIIPHSVNPDNRQTQPIRVTVRFTLRTFAEIPYLENVYYTVVTATAHWDEYRALGAHRRHRAERRFIQLREDYFFKSAGIVL